MPDGKWVSKANLQTFWQMVKSNLAAFVTEDVIDVLPTMLPEELNKVLPTMVGEQIDNKFGDDIGDNVTSWLTEHVTPTGSAVVVDDTLTIAGAAADAKKTGDEISGLKEDFSFSDNGQQTISISDLEQGSYDGQGRTTTQPTRIRTKGFISVKKGEQLSFTAGTNVKSIFVGYFTTSGVFIRDGSWISNSHLEQFENDYKIILVFRKGNTSESISPSEYDATTNIVKKWVVRDNDIANNLDALIGKLNSVGVKTLSYSDMAWESGWYTNTGEIQPHAYYIHSNIIQTVPGTTIQYTNLRAPSNFIAQIACFKNGIYDNASSQKGEAYTAYNSGSFTVPDGVDGVSFITYMNFDSYPVAVTMTVVESRIENLEDGQNGIKQDVVTVQTNIETLKSGTNEVIDYILPDGFPVSEKYYDKNGALQQAQNLSTTGIIDVPYGIKSIYYKAYRNIDIPTILFFDTSMQIVGTVIATTGPVYGDVYYEGYAEIPTSSHYMEFSINNTISEQYVTVTYSKADNNAERIKLLEADPLYGKKITCTGDSITSAIHSVPYNGYVAQIANAHGMTIDNQAIWGAVFPQNKTSGGEPRGCIYDTIALMDASADIVVISGGINDAEYYASDSYWGSVTPDYDDTLDTETFCGALEAICKEALQKWSGKPIIFVFEHRMTLDNTTYGAHFNDVQYPLMVEILEKWGIPYVDLYHEMPSLSYNDGYKTAYTTGDGVHPNYDGYAKFYVPRVYSKIKEVMGI